MSTCTLPSKANVTAAACLTEWESPWASARGRSGSNGETEADHLSSAHEAETPKAPKTVKNLKLCQKAQPIIRIKRKQAVIECSTMLASAVNLDHLAKAESESTCSGSDEDDVEDVQCAPPGDAAQDRKC